MLSLRLQATEIFTRLASARCSHRFRDGCRVAYVAMAPRLVGVRPRRLGASWLRTARRRGGHTGVGRRRRRSAPNIGAVPGSAGDQAGYPDCSTPDPDPDSHGGVGRTLAGNPTPPSTAETLLQVSVQGLFDRSSYRRTKYATPRFDRSSRAEASTRARYSWTARLHPSHV